MVIFDGLDELLDTSYRREVTDRVELFCTRYPLTRVLVTSRRVGYHEAPMDDKMFETFEVGPFCDEQVHDYVVKWFGQEYESDGDAALYTDAFMNESESVADLRTNPLMLALMCIIYRGQRFIPRNRPEVYERCATMLFERWDSYRHIYTKLEAGQVVDPILKHLAYWLFTDPNATEGVRESELVKETAKYLFARSFEDKDVAVRAADEFVRFCRGRAWVFSDAGSTAEGERLYTFTHRTFMEYFAAAQVTRLSDSPEAAARKLLRRVAKGEWDVVAQLVVQIENKNLRRRWRPGRCMYVARRPAATSDRKNEHYKFYWTVLRFSNTRAGPYPRGN